MYICITMKTATIRDLRYDFPRVEAWLLNGDEVELTRHGRPIAKITPVVQSQPRVAKPDIMARLERTWGERILSTDQITAMRTAELEEEEG